MKERPAYLNDRSRYVLLLPAFLVVLLLSVFPLLLSIVTALSRIEFARGGLEVEYVGLRNFERLLQGSQQRRFLGRLDDPTTLGWIILAVFMAGMIYWLFRYVIGPRRRLFGILVRVITILIAGVLLWLVIGTSSGEGLPGTLVVTLIFVFGGVTAQYILGLILALLLTQNLRGKRFFRVVFLLPMMITPVGIGFLFRMLTDTSIGPVAPLWTAVGLYGFSWVDNPATARLAVIIGDTWQWTPFVFIILLAALEGLPQETVEAALVDGANRKQMFRYIILPQIVPVSTTVILIRIIEAFKIIDMPNALTGGGPGTATESMSLHAYNLWRGIDLGTSSALAYCLLFVVTFVALVFVNFIRQRLVEST